MVVSNTNVGGVGEENDDRRGGGGGNGDGRCWLSDPGLAPCPRLVRALREDNRACVEETLTRGGVDVRRALVFADAGLESVVLRHALGDPGTWNAETAKRVRAARRRDGPPPPRRDRPPPPTRLGVVATCVLTDDDDDDGRAGRRSGGAGRGDDRHRASTNSSSNSNPFDNTSIVFEDDAFESSRSSAPSSSWSSNEDLDAVERALRSDEGLEEVVYVCRPDPARSIRRVAAVVRRLRAAAPRSSTHRIVLVPRHDAASERALIDEGLLPDRFAVPDVVDDDGGRVVVDDVQLDLVPIDRDLLVTEAPRAFADAHADGAATAVAAAVVRSLLRLQDAAGPNPRLVGIGPLGERVVARAVDARREERVAADDDDDEPEPEIDGAVVVDRRSDLVTPMLSPLTYEGLVDEEVAAVDRGFAEVDASVVAPDADDDDQRDRQHDHDHDQEEEKVKVLLALNGSDALFDEVRDQNVEKFGRFLQDQAKALKASHSNFTNKDKDLTEIHQFVKQIPVFTKNLRSLTQHIHLAERVKKVTDGAAFRERWQIERAMLEGESRHDDLEDLLARGEESPYRVLRLLVLQSLTGGGVRGSKFDHLRRELVQTHGHRPWSTALERLERVGALRRQVGLTGAFQSASAFGRLRQSLRLIRAEVDASDPDDAAYVSSGYAPVTTRLVQAAVRGWSGVVATEIAKDLSATTTTVAADAATATTAPFVEATQTTDDPRDDDAVDFATATERAARGPRLGHDAAERKRRRGGVEPVLAVVFVGGVTYMEIAALRFLSRRPSFPYRVLCVATSVVNGTTLLESLVAPAPAPASSV